MNGIDLTTGFEQAWKEFISFVPRLFLAIVILVAGYFLARLACRLFRALLDRLGFYRLVDKSGINKALKGARHSAADLLTKLVFYALMLFVLQLAFSSFGANPVSALIIAVIAFLPKIFAAVLIIVIASAVAAGVKEILQGFMVGLSYGRVLASLAAAFIVATGIFAALSQMEIAPAIINGLFYAILAVIAGSGIVAIGGGGIVPMRRQWEKLLTRLELESTERKSGHVPDAAADRSETWKEEAEQSVQHKTDVRSFPQ